MERINTSTKAADLYGPGKHGFQASGPGGAQPTQLSADWCNSVQEELANAIEGAGLSVGGGMSQLLAAINALADAKAILRGNFTGKISHCFGSTAPDGWVKRHGGTIGNAASGATERANADTEALFIKIWNETSNTGEFVIQESTGAAGTRGASAAADFAAGKRMPLPDDRGRYDRGLNTSGSGLDAGRVLASAQADTLKAHSHVIKVSGEGFRSPADYGRSTYTTLSSSPDGTTESTGDTETTPANRAYLAIIKL